MNVVKSPQEVQSGSFSFSTHSHPDTIPRGTRRTIQNSKEPYICRSTFVEDWCSAICHSKQVCSRWQRAAEREILMTSTWNWKIGSFTTLALRSGSLPSPQNIMTTQLSTIRFNSVIGMVHKIPVQKCLLWVDGSHLVKRHGR